jgi:hypothetical protein
MMKKKSTRQNIPQPHTLCLCVSRWERETNGQKKGKRRMKSRAEKIGHYEWKETHTPKFAVERTRKM